MASGFDEAQVRRDNGGRFATQASTEQSSGLSTLSDSKHASLLDDAPLVSFGEVIHVGTLDIEQRERWSYEGEGLSVSVHPDEWEEICDTTSGTRWAFRRPDGEPLRFIDWHALRGNVRDRVRDWGQQNGWLERRDAYAVTYVDCETDLETTIICDTWDEAEAEADELDAVRVEERDVWRPTESFPDSRVSLLVDPTDVLVGVYVREHMPDVDGVWWNDTYDPDNLSCPRGSIVRPLTDYRVQEAEGVAEDVPPETCTGCGRDEYSVVLVEADGGRLYCDDCYR